MLRFLQASLKYVNQEVPVMKAGFRKGRGNRDDQHLLDYRESKFQKNIYFYFLVWITVKQIAEILKEM